MMKYVSFSSLVDNSAPSIPEITVTDLSANENDTKSSSTKQEITPHSDSSHALTKIQPRLSATPVPIPKSPLKHPTPTIPVSPDKRTRTLSISEVNQNSSFSLLCTVKFLLN